MKIAKAIYVGNKETREVNFTSEEYAEWSDLNTVMGMATRVFFRKNNVNVQQVLTEFVNQSTKGENVLLKSFNNFSKTALERICFIHNFSQVFEVESLKNGLDFFQLFKLLCSDFPQEIITRAVQSIYEKKEQNYEELLHLPIDGKIFVYSLYTNFVYMSYIEELQRSQIKTIQQLAEWIKNMDFKIEKYLEKPPFHIAAQAIVSLINRKSLLSQTSNLYFITENNFNSFIKENINQDKNEVNMYEYLHALINDPEHQLLIKKNNSLFQAVPEEFAEIQRILSQKEACETPSNVKKNPKNKK